MRLLFVTGSFAYGGAERHAVALMNRLCGRGHQCHAVCIKNGGELRERIRTGREGTVRCLDAACYFDWRALRDLARHIDRTRPSAIVAANAYALMYAALALRLSHCRARLIVTFHSTRLTSVKERLQMLAYRPLFWTADRLIFVCAAQKRYWVKRALFARANAVIHNGVDTGRYRCAEGDSARGRLRAGLGYSEGDFVIGLPALLRPEKNHLQLVDAVAILIEAGIPARALMIGDGEMRPRIEARARARGIAHHVFVTGLQDDVRPYVAACDAIVLCSHTEAMSMAAIEAMAMGKPVVHSAVGGAAELVFPGFNGYLFPAGDTAALVDRLAVLRDPGVAGGMGGNARKLVEVCFSEEIMVDRYEQMLLEVCGVSPRTAAAGLA